MAGCVVTPENIETTALREMLQRDQEVIDRIRVPVDGPLTLGDIMARAVLTNLDQRVNNLEEALALGAFEMARYDMLPSAALSSTYYDRDNENAARSISVLTRQESLEPSTSQEPEHAVSDLRLSWNLLDFGVSYYQAKQEADRYLIAAANRKKALIDLLQEARSAYWRALAAQRLREPVAEVIRDATAAYDEINEGIAQQIYPSMVEALQMKKELFTLIGDLRTLQGDLEQATILLANFINAPSGTALVLADADELPALPELDADVATLEQVALVNSSEILEEAYNTRIELAETKKALLRLLPGLEFGYTGNYDTNKYLYNNDWNEASVRVSWNLLRLAGTRQALKNSDLRDDLQLQRRLAANMAVVTRLNLALHQYATQMNALDTARELQDIDTQIAQFTNNAVASNSEARLNLVRTRAEALTTNLAYFQSYAQVQEAYGDILVSLGLNPLPEDYNSRSVGELSALLTDTNARWLEGTLPLSQIDGAAPSAASPLAPAAVPALPALSPAAAVIGTEADTGADVNGGESPQDVPAAAALARPEEAIERTLAAWLDSWAAQDLDGYFAHYLPALSPLVDVPEAEWRSRRAERITSPEWIELSYDRFEVVGIEGDTATVRLWIDYRTPDYSDRTLKELRLGRVLDRWEIVMEQNLETTAPANRSLALQ